MTAPVARCGTPSGATRHSRAGEKPCNACARAKSEYDARWRNADGRRRRDRLKARAQTRALGQLKDAHPEEYRGLYEAAKAEVAAEMAAAEAVAS